jgi:pimeloyl-ACP methyl ester carboxylesterase
MPDSASTLKEASPIRVSRERAEVQVGGETIRYEIDAVDARTPEQQARDARRGHPEGQVLVVIPGHGQTVMGPRRLVAAAARLSRSKIAWCIDPTPAAGGDLAEAQAIAQIVEQRLAAHFPAEERPQPLQATILGWSHGGGEALRAARRNPALFPHYLGVCPAGLVERTFLGLVGGFFLEAARILAAELRHLRWAGLVETVRVGLDAGWGLILDMVRSRSLRRLVDDIRWACHKVPGPGFDYPGHVVLLFGKRDTVIRWQDAFPGCSRPEQLAECLPAFQQQNFSRARQVDVRLVEGNHMGPGLDPGAFLRPGLALAGQLEA